MDANLGTPNCGKCRGFDMGRRYAWRQYYQLLGEEYQHVLRYNRLLNELQEIEAKNNFELPPHFKQEMVECLKELECPVCLEMMTAETFNYTTCFHKVCKPCVESVKSSSKKCPICRKKI